MKKSTGMAPDGAYSPRVSAGREAITPSKWSLLQVIEEIREPLGLKGTSISLLRAMISFVKGDHINAARDDGHICFASNVALAKRTHVSVQTVERHITKLVSLKLLTRRSSANGKRWARRDANGSIVLATGLSLMPLLNRHAEFIQLNQKYQERLARLSILRDKCAIALATLKTYLPVRSDLQTLVDTARNFLRRRATEEALGTLLSDITHEIQSVTEKNTENLRGADPESEGHIEPHLNQSVKEKESETIDVSPAQMERAFPRLCAELRTARNQEDCGRRMGDIAGHLNLGELWHEIQRHGPTKSFMTLGYLLERIETIKRPSAYASRLLDNLSNHSTSWHTLLKASTREGRHATRLRA